MKIRLLFILSLTWAFSMPASATIVSGQVTGGGALSQGGEFINLSVPFTDSNPNNTVGNNTFQTPNLYGFDESQNIGLTSDLSVNILADGLGGQTGAGSILAGTTVASHYVFFDPDAFTSQQGTVSFDSNILAIITSRTNLFVSDLLVNTGVFYLNPGARGLESAQDTVSIASLRSIFVNWSASTPGDYIRVLTEFSPTASVVPVPAAAWLFGTFLFGVFGFSRVKRKI